ncbi:hypothetical protein STCU_04716 [Strigomonas culicis]|uniref:Uncharacterized protein n=1 Tax=Strigomonas culicis TaxID=28005 RepID=S9UJN8_9TRYP|nr:hypothetical protein STCU_04716 [Strigomonas culicis]|eukprot:EPY29118.1 hypothetical protein STCU_04716 [Strigomonas culicis]
MAAHAKATADARPAASPTCTPKTGEAPTAANTAPPARRPAGNAPVQHTLVSANTYNHLSIYFVAHQDGTVLYSAPVQTLSASIASRKITAQCLFMMGKEEVNPPPDIPEDAYEYNSALTSPMMQPASRRSVALSSPIGRSPEGISAGQFGTPGAAPRAAGGSCCYRKRDTVDFARLPVRDGEAEVLFRTNALMNDQTVFVDADPKTKTIHAAYVSLVVEPLLLFGNQNGDLFVFSVLEEKIVQRVNYNRGSSRLSSETAAAGKGCCCTGGKVPGSAGRTFGSAGGSTHQYNKVVNASVSSIVEIQNGIEKKLAEMTQYAAVAKRNNKSRFNLSEPLTAPAAGKERESQAYMSCTAFENSYYAVSPSLFAAGFDNGHVLLLCVTSEGAWILSHLTSEASRLTSISAISVRLPCFFTRLWTHFHEENVGCCASVSAPGRRPGTAPRQLLVVADTTLFVADEEQHVAAIACNGGTIALVRVPGLEPLATVHTYEYDAVGGIITLRWAASTARNLVTPDLLIAAGEDDTLTAFQLNANNLFALVANSSVAQGTPQWLSGSPGAGPSMSANTTFSSSQPSSSDTTSIAGGLLSVLEKKLFHKSWVSHITVLPLVMPASKIECGLPRYLGCSLIATSYDHSTSFWPILFPAPNGRTKDSRDTSMPSCGGRPFRSEMDSSNTDSATNNTSNTNNNNNANNDANCRYIIVDGPTAAQPLHSDLALTTHVAGGGTSFFLASACCRGRVKLWSVMLRQV